MKTKKDNLIITIEHIRDFVLYKSKGSMSIKDINLLLDLYEYADKSIWFKVKKFLYVGFIYISLPFLIGVFFFSVMYYNYPESIKIARYVTGIGVSIVYIIVSYAYFTGNLDIISKIPLSKREIKKAKELFPILKKTKF